MHIAKPGHAQHTFSGEFSGELCDKFLGEPLVGKLSESDLRGVSSLDPSGADAGATYVVG